MSSLNTKGIHQAFSIPGSARKETVAHAFSVPRVLATASFDFYIIYNVLFS